MDVKDSNGTVLKDGNSVILIKDLKVKGAGDHVEARDQDFVHSPDR